MARAERIDEVVDQLERIALGYQEQASPMGYFPALYRQVTMGVRDAIGRGVFDDADRMERFDVIFANRYFDALELWDTQAEAVARSWRAAFETAEKRPPHTVLHLMLGINAHVNLDLPVSAADVCPDDIMALKDDFFRINDIFIAVIDTAPDALGDHLPAVKVGDHVAGRSDEDILGFSIRRARSQAWEKAVLLAAASSADQRSALIQTLDDSTRNLATVISITAELKSTIATIWDMEDVVNVTHDDGHVRSVIQSLLERPGGGSADG